MYGIDKKVYKSLINYFLNNNNIEKVIIFGSRAKGTENINSDIDLFLIQLQPTRATTIWDK